MSLELALKQEININRSTMKEMQNTLNEAFKNDNNDNNHQLKK